MKNKRCLKPTSEELTEKDLVIKGFSERCLYPKIFLNEEGDSTIKLIK